MKLIIRDLPPKYPSPSTDGTLLNKSLTIYQALQKSARFTEVSAVAKTLGYQRSNLTGLAAQ